MKPSLLLGPVSSKLFVQLAAMDQECQRALCSANPAWVPHAGRSRTGTRPRLPPSSPLALAAFGPLLWFVEDLGLGLCLVPVASFFLSSQGHRELDHDIVASPQVSARQGKALPLVWMVHGSVSSLTLVCLHTQCLLEGCPQGCCLSFESKVGVFL